MWRRLNWSVLGVLIAVLALLHQVVISLVDLNPKGLQLRVESTSELMAALNPKLGISVTKGGAELDRPALSVIEVSNVGGKPIATADFESKLVVSGGEASIVDVNLGDTEPSQLKPLFSIVDHKLVVEPLLLNPGDKLKFSVLTISASPEFDLVARVSGVKRVNVLREEAQKKKLAVPVLIMASLMGPTCLIMLIILVGGGDKLTNARAANIIAAGLFGLNASFGWFMALVREVPAEYRAIAGNVAIALIVLLTVLGIAASARYLVLEFRKETRRI